VSPSSPRLWRSRFASESQSPRSRHFARRAATTVVAFLRPQFEMPNLGHDDILVPAALDGSTDRGPAARNNFASICAPQTGLPSRKPPPDGAALSSNPELCSSTISSRVSSVSLPPRRQSRRPEPLRGFLLGAVLACLLVACTNVQTCSRARYQRAREISVRTALGANARTPCRQSLTESLLLGVLGGLAGCWIAQLLLRLFVSMAPEVFRDWNKPPSTRVLLFALAVSLRVCIIFGLASAIAAGLRPELLTEKKNPRRSRACFARF